MKLIKGSLILSALAAGSFATLLGCGGKASQADFPTHHDQAVTLKHGQTEAEVIALLGEPKERKSGSFGPSTLLVYSGEQPEDNHVMIVITAGKVSSGMATKNGEVTTFARDAAHSQPATGGRPKAPPSFSGKAPGP